MTVDTNELRRLAQAAKNSCESVEWSHEFRSGRYSQGVIISGEEKILIVCGANYGCWRDADDDGDSQFKALGDFVAASNPAAITELLDRLEAAEKEIASWKGLAKQFGNEADALRAEVEAMEKQFPICRVKDIRRAHYMTKVVGLDPEAWLYALPGAQPTPSTPNGWKLVPIEPTPSMAASIELSTANSVSEIYRAMLAATPEAKP